MPQQQQAGTPPSHRSHLLPSLPYHSLPEAHRRLAAQLGAGSTYAKANYPGLLPLVGHLAKSTMTRR